jgi:hypothetical protein
MYSGHKFYQFETTSGMSRGTDTDVHSYNYKKAMKERLVHKKPETMPGTTIPVAIANRATSSGNNFMSANSPDVMRMTKGCRIVGIV